MDRIQGLELPFVDTRQNMKCPMIGNVLLGRPLADTAHRAKGEAEKTLAVNGYGLALIA